MRERLGKEAEKGEKTLPVVWPFRGARVGRRSGSHVYTVFFTKCVLISRDKCE